MTYYIIDTHIFIWFLDKNKKLKTSHLEILLNKEHTFVFSAIVLAEIKYLISLKRITVDFEKVIDYLAEAESCIIYPVDEDIVENMPERLNIHDALIVATGIVYKNILREDVKILTEDEEIIKTAILPVV